MITEALRHCPGIGPARLARLHELGIRSWTDVLDRGHGLPFFYRRELIAESRRCLAALEARDVRYFVDRFETCDKWRILSQFLDDTTFFDIETTGLEYDARITVIACWHRGELRTFVEHENLDEFLSLLDDVTLLASFNGSSFDVPRVLDAFHIPELPCPHLDLRWPCYHQGFTGTLKAIADSLDIARPVDLQHVDGFLAVQLWQAWQQRRDAAARARLIRYCAADVLLLVLIAHRLARRATAAPAELLWSRLPPTTGASSPPASPSPTRSTSYSFGPASPRRLRAQLGQRRS